MLTLVAARIFVGARWTTAGIAGGYLVYRIVAWTLLTGTGFPPSIPLFLLIGGAIAIDLSFLALANGYLRAIVGAALAAGATAHAPLTALKPHWATVSVTWIKPARSPSVGQLQPPAARVEEVCDRVVDAEPA